MTLHASYNTYPLPSKLHYEARTRAYRCRESQLLEFTDSLLITGSADPCHNRFPVPHANQGGGVGYMLILVESLDYFFSATLQKRARDGALYDSLLACRLDYPLLHSWCRYEKEQDWVRLHDVLKRKVENIVIVVSYLYSLYGPSPSAETIF